MFRFLKEAHDEVIKVKSVYASMDDAIGGEMIDKWGTRGAGSRQQLSQEKQQPDRGCFFLFS